MIKQHQGFVWLLLLNFLTHSVVAYFPPLEGDEAYFWEWSRHLALGYYSHPPMTGWLIALVTSIFSTTVYTVRLTSIFLHLITLLAVYCISWDITKKERFSLLSGSIYSLMPISFILGTGITTDSSLICFFALAVYFTQKAIINESKRDWYFGAISCGGMLLSKFMAVLFFPAIFLFLVINKPFRPVLLKKEPYLAFLLSFLIFAPFLYWNFQNEWLTFQFNFMIRHEDQAASFLKIISYGIT